MVLIQEFVDLRLGKNHPVKVQGLHVEAVRFRGGRCGT